MRFKQIIETTTAGSVATVAMPMMTQTRENTNVKGLKPVDQMKKVAKKKGPYSNSIAESKVTEDDLAEQDLIVIPGQGRLRKTGFVKHDLDQGEHEGHTLKNSLHTIARAASELDERLSVQSEFPEWVSEKIGAAKGMMVTVMDYLISSQEMQHDRDAVNEGEVSTSNLRTMYDLARMVKYHCSPEGQESLNELLKIIKWYMDQADQNVTEGSEQKPAITYKDYTLQYDYQTEDDDPEGYSTATTYYFDVLKDGDRVGEAEYFDYFGNLTIRINGKTKEFGFRHPLASQISQLVSSLPDEQKKDLSDPKFESQGVAEAFPNPGSGSTGSNKEDKRIAAALRKKHIPTTPNDKKEKGVAEGSGESYIIVRTDSEGKKDVFAGNFDTYERAQKELDDCLAHPLHTKYKQKFEIKRKGQEGVAEAFDLGDLRKAAASSRSPEDERALKRNPDFGKLMQKSVNKHNKAVVKTKQAVGSRVADIGAGGKEYNVKTDAAWDAAKKSVEESWKTKLGAAALAGAAALGGGSAQAQNAPSGYDNLPSIVAQITFQVDGKSVTKDINLGTSYQTPGQASQAVKDFMKSKGIKFYNFNLHRADAQPPLVSKDEMNASNQEYQRQHDSNNLSNTPYSATGDEPARLRGRGYTSSSRPNASITYEGSVPKEKQKTPYRDINGPEYKAAADKQKEKMAKDKAAEPGKKLADKIDKKK